MKLDKKFGLQRIMRWILLEQTSTGPSFIAMKFVIKLLVHNKEGNNDSQDRQGFD